MKTMSITRKRTYSSYRVLVNTGGQTDTLMNRSKSFQMLSNRALLGRELKATIESLYTLMDRQTH